MILEAYYADKKVLLEVPMSGLVFNGQKFVKVEDALHVQLVPAIPTSYSVPTVTDKDSHEVFEILSQLNSWICKVIGIHSNAPAVNLDVISFPNPAAGKNLCGIVFDGSKITTVQVFNKGN
jgi:hypothetical protein